MATSDIGYQIYVAFRRS